MLRRGSGIALCLAVLLVAAPACDRKHESSDFSPTAPGVVDALTLVLSALEIPADGFSTVTIEARIDAAADFRTLRFETTLGKFVDEGAEDKTSIDKEADFEGRVRVQLRSEETVGRAIVTVKALGTGSNNQETVLITKTVEVDFVEVREAIALAASPGSGIADGSTPVILEARIREGSDPTWKTVTFRTTAGKINGIAANTDVDVTADAERVARAELTSDSVGTAQITATIKEFSTASVTLLVEFDEVRDALVLTATPAASFADGFSPVNLEARISDGSPVTWRTVVFRTTLGKINNISANTDVPVVIDSQRVARAQLISSDIGTAQVRATIQEFSTVSAVVFVNFDERNPDLISIGTSAASVPADGASQISVFADIDAREDDRTVDFTTSNGTFPESTSSNKQTITKTADNSNRATVRLRSDTTIGPVFLTATVSDTSAETTIQFVRALPDRIDVQVGNFELDKSSEPERTITVALDRDVGMVSQGTEVVYEIFDEATGTAIADIVFFDVKTSNASELSTAKLFVGDSAFTGLAVVRASVPGSGAAPGEETIKIVP